MTIKFSPDYYRVGIKFEPTSAEDRSRWRELYRQVNREFPNFDCRRNKTEREAKMFAGKIRKAFPGIELEITPACDV